MVFFETDDVAAMHAAIRAREATRARWKGQLD
jgi:hypothetical protein